MVCQEGTRSRASYEYISWVLRVIARSYYLRCVRRAHASVSRALNTLRYFCCIVHCRFRIRDAHICVVGSSGGSVCALHCTDVQLTRLCVLGIEINQSVDACRERIVCVVPRCILRSRRKLSVIDNQNRIFSAKLCNILCFTIDTRQYARSFGRMRKPELGKNGGALAAAGGGSRFWCFELVMA